MDYLFCFRVSRFFWFSGIGFCVVAWILYRYDHIKDLIRLYTGFSRRKEIQDIQNRYRTGKSYGKRWSFGHKTKALSIGLVGLFVSQLVLPTMTAGAAEIPNDMETVIAMEAETIEDAAFQVCIQPEEGVRLCMITDQEGNTDPSDVAEEESLRYIYDGNLQICLEYMRVYLDEEEKEKSESLETSLVVWLWKDGCRQDIQQPTWEHIDGSDQAVIDLTEEGDYMLQVVKLTDGTTELTEDTDSHFDSIQEEELLYQSPVWTIDTTCPDVRVSYAEEKNIYNEAVEVEITVTDRCFVPEDLEWYISRTNRKNEIFPASLSGLTSREAWIRNGDVWNTTLYLAGDGSYSWELTATDQAGHKAETYYSTPFIIDQNSPSQTDFNVSYSTPRHIWYQWKENDVWRYLAYGQKMEWKVSVCDSVSGIERLEWRYLPELTDLLHGVNGEQHGTITHEQLLYSDDGTEATAVIPIHANEEMQYRGQFMITAIDGAGNATEWNGNSNQIMIADSLAPNITLQLPEAVKMTDGTYYYDAPICAIICIEENNFYAEDAKVWVNGELINHLEWNYQEGIYSTEVQLSGDGTYVVASAYTDRSGNAHTNGGRAMIVIDRTAPKMSVEYEKADGKSGKTLYYKDEMSGVVTVTDEHFDPSELQVIRVATDEFGNVKADAAEVLLDVAWELSADGDYRGTFSTNQEGWFLIRVSGRDMAGNEMETEESESMCVDRTDPVIRVSPILQNEATNDSGFAFRIICKDSGSGLATAGISTVLTALVKSETGTYEHEVIELAEPEYDPTGHEAVLCINNLAEDGIYQLTITAKDLVGHENSTICTDEGSLYDTISFSINRNGSMFMLEQVDDILAHYYVADVADNIVVKENNVDALDEYEVLLNGTMLTEGKDYEVVVPEKSDDSWYEQTYIVNKKCFEEEGRYQLSVRSIDKTGTASYSDVKDADIEFVLDRTAPEVNIIGLLHDHTYIGEQHEVALIPTDNGGKLKSVQVIAFEAGDDLNSDRNGTILLALDNDNDMELDHYLAENDGTITADIPQIADGTIVIRCADYAYHSDGSTNIREIRYDHITVTKEKQERMHTSGMHGKCSIFVIIMMGGVCLSVVYTRKKLQNRR